MKRMVHLLAFLMAGIPAAAQDGSLVQDFVRQYELATTDSARALFLWQASFNAAHSDANKGLEYGKMALAFSLKIHSLKLAGDSYNCIGLCFDSVGERDSALLYYNSSIETLERGGHHCATASVYSNMGGLLKKSGELAQALQFFMKTEEIQRGCEDIGYHASTLYSIGACYNSLEDYDRALEYFHRSLSIEQKNENVSKQGNVYNGMANAYLGLDRLDDARASYTNALHCFKQASNIYNVAYAYEGIAQLHEKQHHLDSAIFYCSHALAIFDSLKVNVDIVFESVLLADFLRMNHDYAEAEKVLLHCLPIANEDELFHDKQNILFSLSLIAEQKGDFKSAYRYLVESSALRDSLKLDEQKQELTELAGKYETEKRDKQILVEQARNESQRIENEKQRQQKYFFMAGTVLLAALVFVFIARYRQKRNASIELEQKNVIIEKEKERAEKSERMKQQFLANMSHEIRTPMNAITGLSRLLLDQPHDERTSSYLRAIRHSGENLQVILDDILDAAKIEAGKLSIEKIPFLLSAELENIEHAFTPRAVAKAIGFRLIHNFDTYSEIMGDPARLSQVLNNLVGNAIKFTEKGEVVLRVNKKADETVCFEVSDTGIGIRIEDQEKIFESFSQANTGDSRRYGGTGLGLAIARELVTLMGGDLKVKSEIGKGSAFSFSIPFEMAIQFQKKDELSVKYDLALNVLVAEDNEYNYIVTHDTLVKYFPVANIFHAADGMSLMQYFHEDDYDLILMDVQMPLKDGYECTREIRLAGSTIPILGLTASVVRSDLDNCIQAGMNGYISKPFREKDFVKAILDVVDMGSNILTHIVAHEEEDKKELNRLFLEIMPARIDELKMAIEQDNFSLIKRLLHAMRPQLVRSDMADLNEVCMRAEVSTIPGIGLMDDIKYLVAQVERKLISLRSIN